MNKRHPFKRLNYNGHKVAIDKDIAPLLANMWELGIGTTACCQAHCALNCNHKIKRPENKVIPTKHCYNSVWIAFEDTGDMERLFDIVAEDDEKDGSMYHLMGCDTFVGGRKWNKPKDGWAFDFLMYDHRGKDEWSFVLQPQLTFPRKHLAYVEQRIKLAL